MPSDDDAPAPLRREVKHLGALLGRVIEEAEGPELLADVERLRRATISHRREPTNERRHDVLELVEAMDAHRTERVASAVAATIPCTTPSRLPWRPCANATARRHSWTSSAGSRSRRC